jgi:RNA polymerase sigma-70 factor (ECF subfamily)
MSIFKKITNPTDDYLLTEKSYEDFFRSHYASLCRFILKIVKDKDLTEDIVQDVFIKLWEKKDTLIINSSLKSYLYRSAINTAYNELNTIKRYPKKILEGEEMENSIVVENEERLEVDELEEKIAIIIAQLPEACREIFTLSRFEAMSYKEIAETLSISVKTVENQMGKALKTFRIALTSAEK